ncbi:MAG: translocation/assembly module TamB domain-containing protein [Planctomycetota bacterium]
MTDALPTNPPPEPPSQRKRRRWPARVLRGLLAAGVLAALLVILAYLTRQHTLHPLIVRIAPWVAARFGPYELSLDEVEGDWWSAFELHGLTFVERGEAASVERLTLERVRVEGGVLRLLTGDLSRLTGVTLAGLDATLDLRPSDEVAAPVVLPWSTSWPLLHVEDARCDVRTAAGLIQVRGARCVARDTSPLDAGVTSAGGSAVVTRTAAREWTFEADVQHEALTAHATVVLAVARGAKVVDGSLNVVTELALPAGSPLAPYLVVADLASSSAAGLAAQAQVTASTATASAHADLRSDRIEVSGALVVPERGRVEFTGRLGEAGGAPSLALSTEGIALEALMAAPLRARVTSDLSELGWLASLDPMLRRVEGQLDVEVDVAGTLRAPEPRGRVTLHDGRVRAIDLPGLDGLELRVEVTPTRVELVEARGELGAAPLRASGTLALAAPYALDVRLAGENVLLARSADVRLRADVALAAAGPLRTPAVTGSIALVGSRARLEVDLLGALEGALPRRRASGAGGAKVAGLPVPALGPAGGTLDVALTTREPVRVEGNIARGALRADLRLTGDTARPILVGQVFADPLELALPAATVRYESGAVRFTADQPNVPQLELFGEARVAGYDVQVNLSGAYDEPEVRLSSTPPLSAEQLLLLVVSGRPPSEARQLSSAGEALAVYVAKDLVRSWFDDGGFDERRSFLSRIEVVTGRDVSKSGVLTLEATYLVRERVAGREGGVYAVIARDAYEDYNMGLRFVVRLR